MVDSKVFIKSVAPDISECVIDVSHVIRGEYLIPDTQGTFLPFYTIQSPVGIVHILTQLFSGSALTTRYFMTQF